MASSGPIWPATLEGLASNVVLPDGWDLFLSKLGAEPSSPCEVFSLIQEDDIADALLAVVDENGYTPFQKAGLIHGLRLVYRALGLEPVCLGAPPQSADSTASNTDTSADTTRGRPPDRADRAGSRKPDKDHTSERTPFVTHPPFTAV